MKQSINIEPLINDEHDIIADRYEFIVTIFGHDMEYRDFRFVTLDDGYVNMVADHRNYGEICIGHGWTEEKAEVGAFNRAWEIYCNHPYNIYGNWESVGECYERLNVHYGSKIVGTKLGQDYLDKIVKLERFKAEVSA